MHDCTDLIRVEGVGGESISYLGYIFATIALSGMHSIDIPVLVMKTTCYHDAVPLLVSKNYLSITEVSSSQDVPQKLRLAWQLN